MFLAFLGAEIAGGGGAEYAPPPSRARNSQTLSRGRVKRSTFLSRRISETARYRCLKFAVPNHRHIVVYAVKVSDKSVKTFEI